MPKNPAAAAVAALDICDSLLFTMVELKILTASQAIKVLVDVAETHSSATVSDGHQELHQQTVERIQKLIKSRVGLHHSPR